MDDYNSSSAEENESAGGVEHTCYLDEDDVQLKERDTDGDERFRLMAIESEEHLANMRSKYKGSDLVHLCKWEEVCLKGTTQLLKRVLKKW